MMDIAATKNQGGSTATPSAFPVGQKRSFSGAETLFQESKGTRIIQLRGLRELMWRGRKIHHQERTFKSSKPGGLLYYMGMWKRSASWHFNRAVNCKTCMKDLER